MNDTTLSYENLKNDVESLSNELNFDYQKALRTTMGVIFSGNCYRYFINNSSYDYYVIMTVPSDENVVSIPDNYVNGIDALQSKYGVTIKSATTFDVSWKSSWGHQYDKVYDKVFVPSGISFDVRDGNIVSSTPKHSFKSMSLCVDSDSCYFDNNYHRYMFGFTQNDRDEFLDIVNEHGLDILINVIAVNPNLHGIDCYYKLKTEPNKLMCNLLTGIDTHKFTLSTSTEKHTNSFDNWRDNINVDNISLVKSLAKFNNEQYVDLTDRIMKTLRKLHSELDYATISFKFEPDTTVIMDKLFINEFEKNDIVPIMSRWYIKETGNQRVGGIVIGRVDAIAKLYKKLILLNGNITKIKCYIECIK